MHMLDENTSPPSVEDITVLDEINPVDHPLVHTRAEDKWWRYDFTDETVADGENVIASVILSEGRWHVTTAPTF